VGVSEAVVYYEHAGITIYHGDCREILPSIHADVVVTDPPYGLGDRWSGGTWFTRGVYEKDKCAWDVEPPAATVTAIVALGLPTVLWGGNYFALPPSRCWLVWHKNNAVPTMADAELAWTNLDRPAKAFSRSCGCENRQHPTQKPLALMRWCLGFMPSGTVLDPFMGSGTTLRAAKDLGRKAIGIEIEERYCEIAAKRLAQEVFDFETPAPVQTTIDADTRARSTP
jgi:hypothetical protein